ncbi:cytochrome P450 705A22 isoform X2 [Raphanus sativus]|uniref:Cytochrome P450 705A22 isoform X2 n=1 Tax=Raphanus sativus TaxID=3726 RepID=A0A6J0JHX0_RAPSA|nr:cytochrome P450 705A22 isoform X2 [Raphanus sativus]
MAATFIVDFENFFILIILCLFSFLCYHFFFKKPNDSEGCDLPPSPPSLPIIGHLHHLLSLLLHKRLQKLSSKYGHILYLRVLNVPIVLVSSASIAYEIFKAQDMNVSDRNLPTNEGSLFFGSFGFVTAPYEDYFKFVKKLITTKLLGPQALERSRGVRADEVNQFYLNLVDKAMKKESVEIAKEAMKLISNNTWKMLMGKGFSERGEVERVRGLVAQTDVVSKKFFVAAVLRKPLAKLGISLFKKDLVSISCRYDELLEKSLVEYEEEHNQSSEMLDVLLEACQGEKTAECKITRNHIKALFDFFVAGTVTTTNSVQWTMAEVLNNPKILERLREEIDSVIGKTRLIQETDLPNLPYLQAVVKEALRLHPPAPLGLRSFREGCKVVGFDVLAKTTLIINWYAIMRDPDVWEYPEECRPERFLSSSQEDEIKEEVLKYIPFGRGRRGCPGSNLGYLSVGTAVGVMVQCFDWKIEEDKVNKEEGRGTMTLTMAHPLKCTPLLRNPNLLPSIL